MEINERHQTGITFTYHLDPYPQICVGCTFRFELGESKIAWHQKSTRCKLFGVQGLMN